jgi:hypothetical protein
MTIKQPETIGGMYDKHQIIEEPDEVKISCPVLEASQRGDSLA